MLKLPGYIEKIMAELRKEGYACFVVGGAVRDMMAGEKPWDWDLATDAPLGNVLKIFPKATVISEELSVVRIRSAEDEKNDEADLGYVDVARLRKEKYAPESFGLPSEIIFTDSIESDLERRDFTVNAMACSIEVELIDPYGGTEDVSKRVLKMVGEPLTRLEEDPVRILRAIRLVAERNYSFSGSLQRAIAEKADLLIFGQLEEMAGYIYYRVGAYSSILDRIVFEVEGGGSPDIIEGQIIEHLNDLITVVIGHEWADLTVAVLPITASIQIGEKYSGSGVFRNNSIEPGTYVMTVEAPGYIGEEVELVLNPKETKTLSVALIRNTVPPVVINNYPPGADGYLSSRWVGATPFLVENGGLNEPLMLKKDGYLDLVSALTPSGNTNLDFVMKSTAFNRDEYLKQKRKDFYFNIAGLAISIPMTLLSSGYQTRFLNSIPDATEDNAVQRQQIIFGYKAMTMLFTVGIVLDAMMAAGLIIDMIDYIKVYDNM